jgi:hypothetical protein
LRLDNLLLSGNKGNQGQSVSGDLRLTFVDTAANVVLSKTPRLEKNGANWELTDVDGTVNGFTKTGFGWKLIDPEDDSGEVVASGRTNKDAATNTDGNMVVPCASLMPGKDYTLSVWGQRDGSATAGWSNRATVPVSGMVVRADGSGGCAQVRTPPSYGIEVTGITSGMLRAWKIGGYDDVVFGHTDAVKAAVLAAAVSAGGVNVDAGNPMGWVAANWLGYPTDSLSDDVTSAFSPYAGSLQVFAQELAKDTDALGASAGSLPAGMFSTLTTETLPVSGPGLYLIVDSTQSSGGSLPIIVGTKVFNEALEDVVEDGMVDFMDAGVKGKPRLGRAVVKTSVTDVSKRVVNDAGLDGFDVGSEVEFEIALRVPDLSGLSGVTYDGYAFRVEDTAAPGLTLPQAADVRVLVDVPSPDTDVTATGGFDHRCVWWHVDGGRVEGRVR